MLQPFINIIYTNIINIISIHLLKFKKNNVVSFLCIILQLRNFLSLFNSFNELGYLVLTLSEILFNKCGNQVH